MDDRTIDFIFAGSLESLPPVSSKIVRIFTSSTFTGELITNRTAFTVLMSGSPYVIKIPRWRGTP